MAVQPKVWPSSAPRAHWQPDNRIPPDYGSCFSRVFWSLWLMDSLGLWLRDVYAYTYTARFIYKSARGSFGRGNFYATRGDGSFKLTDTPSFKIWITCLRDYCFCFSHRACICVYIVIIQYARTLLWINIVEKYLRKRNIVIEKKICRNDAHSPKSLSRILSSISPHICATMGAQTHTPHRCSTNSIKRAEKLQYT